jgi:YfiH family protein
VFSFHATVEGDVQVDVAFTDSTLDLKARPLHFESDLAKVEAATGVRFARLTQVHGRDVLVVDAPTGRVEAPEGDALVTTHPGVGLMIRVADCVPLLLADPGSGVVGAAHVGRPGLALEIVPRVVDVMRAQGARAPRAWLGPHVCGGCYEVPAAMREEVSAVVPAAWAETRWGTPSLDIGAGVAAQLEAAGVPVTEVGGCTLEDPKLHSYRRDGADAGRLSGLVWFR